LCPGGPLRLCLCCYRRGMGSRRQHRSHRLLCAAGPPGAVNRLARPAGLSHVSRRRYDAADQRAGLFDHGRRRPADSADRSDAAAGQLWRQLAAHDERHVGLAAQLIFADGVGAAPFAQEAIMGPMGHFERIQKLIIGLLLAYVAIAVALSYWGVVRGAALAERQDNPRRVEAELDRKSVV